MKFMQLDKMKKKYQSKYINALRTKLSLFCSLNPKLCCVNKTIYLKFPFPTSDKLGK